MHFKESSNVDLPGYNHLIISLGKNTFLLNFYLSLFLFAIIGIPSRVRIHEITYIRYYWLQKTILYQAGLYSQLRYQRSF